MRYIGSSMGFQGISADIFHFLRGLEIDNTKTYWTAHQDFWQGKVRPAMADLMTELEPYFGKLRMYRPNRDIRFSKDKTPYKNWVGITTQGTGPGGIGFFFAIEPNGVRFSAGASAFAPDQLKEYRRALDNPVAGNKFKRIIQLIEAEGYQATAGRSPQLKRTPRGYDEKHPRIEYLKWRGAVLRKRYDLADWMLQPALIDKIVEVWSQGLPLVEWIQTNVGPTQVKRR